MPSYRYAIVGAQPQDGIEALIDAYPAYREKIAAFWPELDRFTLRQVPDGRPDLAPAVGEIAVTIVDQVSDEDALAFHTKTIWGAVQCVVERQQCLKYRVPPTAALMHEVVECGINPFLDQFVTAPLALTPGAAPVPTRLPKEIADPFTSGIVMINGVAFTNASTPRFWLLASAGAFDLLGEGTAPLPTIPRGGAIDTASGQLIYGDAVTPAMREYLAGKRGRRWARRHGPAVVN